MSSYELKLLCVQMGKVCRLYVYLADH